MNGVDQWPASEGVNLDPPLACKQLGRPKKSRQRQIDEKREIYTEEDKEKNHHSFYKLPQRKTQ